MKKKRKWKRRKDGVRQRYWYGKKVKKKHIKYKPTRWQHRQDIDESISFFDPNPVSDYITYSRYQGKKSKLPGKRGPKLTKKELARYKSIIKKARKKGYKIPRLNLKKGPINLDEINILESADTEAFLIPDYDHYTNREIYNILMDDDATQKDKDKAFAHELGHIHLFETGQRHSEKRADDIAADILSTTRKDIQNTLHYRTLLRRY